MALGSQGDAGAFEAHLSVLEAQSDVPNLIGAFDKIIASYGGIGFVAAAWMADNPSKILLYASLQAPFAQLDAQSAWWADDPIIPILTAGEVRPFCLEDAWAAPLPSAQPRWEALVAAGLDRGIVFPTSRPPYIGSVLVFGSPDTAKYRSLSDHQSMLHLLSTYFHGQIVDFAPSEDVSGVIRNTLTDGVEAGRQYKLSAREIASLRWLALGKTATDIALIENLSVHTVRSYLRTGMKKLDASSQPQAVARALKYNLFRI